MALLILVWHAVSIVCMKGDICMYVQIPSSAEYSVASASHVSYSCANVCVLTSMVLHVKEEAMSFGTSR